MSLFYQDSNATGANDGSSWADAYSDYSAAIAGLLSIGDDLWVASDHLVGHTTSNLNIQFPDGVRVTSVNTTNNLFQPGAKEYTTGIYDISLSTTIGGTTVLSGCTFESNDNFNLSNSNQTHMKYIDCNLKLTGISGADGFYIIGKSAKVSVEKGTFDYGVSGQQIYVQNAVEINFHEVEFGPSFNELFAFYSTDPFKINYSNCTFTAATLAMSNNTGSAWVNISQCKGPAISNIQNSVTSPGGYVNLWSYDSGDKYYVQHYHRYEGIALESTTVKRTNGATYKEGDVTTGFSMEFRPNANVDLLISPLRINLNAARLDLSTGPVDVDVHIVLQDSSGVPVSLTDMNTVLTIEYPDSTDLALGKTVKSTGKTILDTETALQTETLTFNGTSGTTKQHIVSVTVPQNASMSKAVCNLFLDLSVVLAGTTEMFVCPDPTTA